MAIISSLSTLMPAVKDSIAGSPTGGQMIKPVGLGSAFGGGGGGSAQDGLSQIDSGSSTVAGAIGRAADALGGGGGGGGQIAQPQFKKGGSVKKYTDSNGKLNLGSGRVSTSSKNSKQSNW
jgi:hypothetical protein